jgi:1,4-dihydroxy-2-naphthoate polyprenyltransferase
VNIHPGGVFKMVKKKASPAIWFAELRAEFFTAPAMSVFVGVASAAWFMNGHINWLHAVLTLIVAVLINGGTNTANDYWDHVSGNDKANKTPVRPFTGGSRLIQDGLLEPKGVLIYTFVLFGIAGLIGAYLVYVSGWWTLAIGAFGIITGYFYTAKPIALGSRGFGELIAGLDCGILVAFATFYIQTGTFSWIPILAALPLSLLVSLILYVNEFPDRVADEQTGKNHMVVRLGAERAAKLHFALIFTPYIALAAGIWFGGLPNWTGLAFLTLPILVLSNVQLRANLGDVTKLAPASAMTVMSQLLTGILLTVGFII